MSEYFNDKEYFEKWDHRVMIIMAVVALGLTAGAVVLNIVNQQKLSHCSTAEYVYCGMEKADPHH